MTELPDESIDCVLTSCPYWGLRDYGEDVKEIWGGDGNCKHQWTEAGGGLLHENRNFITGTQEEARGKTRTTHIFKYDKVKSGLCQKCGAWYGQLGLEPTLEMYIEHLLLITLECKRVLKPTGVMWWNHGDSYFTGKGSCRNPRGGNKSWKSWNDRKGIYPRGRTAPNRMSKESPPKCLALQNYRLVIRMIDEQGWILRNNAIWNKPNGMPSSVKDRLANKYEPVFCLVKNTKPRYYWNEKTGLMADRKPKVLKEGIDWDWIIEQEYISENGANIGNHNKEPYQKNNPHLLRLKKSATGKRKKKNYWHSLGYWYDLDAIREPHAQTSIARLFRGVDPGNKYDYMDNPVEHPTTNLSKPRLNIRKITRGPKEIPFEEQSIRPSGGDHHLISNMLTSLQKSILAGRGKNPGDVWIIPTQPRPEAHFACFPDRLCIRPILATCPTEICRKCGKAVDKKPYRKERLQLKHYLKNAIENSKKTREQINQECNFTACSYSRTSFRDDDGWGEALPSVEKWFKMKEIIGFDDAWDWLIRENERRMVGEHKSGIAKAFDGNNWGTGTDIVKDTVGKSGLEGSYAGFQPKPAVEVILVAMKPLSEKTYVDQALRNGKGITWLDEGRIPYKGEEPNVGGRLKNRMGDGYGFKERKSVELKNARFPANLLVSDDALNDGKIRKGGFYPEVRGKTKFFGLNKKPRVPYVYSGKKYEVEGFIKDNRPQAPSNYNDSGSFSRYFSLDAWFEKKLKELPAGVQKTFPFLIVPKASKAEKNRGCEQLYWEKDGSSFGYHQVGRVRWKWLGKEEERIHKETGKRVSLRARGNVHPTVKPIKLVSYLIALGSREGDVVLDPYIGTGRTAIAATMMGRRYIGFDSSPESVKIAKAALSEVQLRLI